MREQLALLSVLTKCYVVPESWLTQLKSATFSCFCLPVFSLLLLIKMIPPRGCAYIVMIHRQDAFRALQKLSRGTYKVNQKAIKVSEKHRLPLSEEKFMCLIKNCVCSFLIRLLGL